MIFLFIYFNASLSKFQPLTSTYSTLIKKEVLYIVSFLVFHGDIKAVIKLQSFYNKSKKIFQGYFFKALLKKR